MNTDKNEAVIEDLTRQIDALYAKGVANWTIEETRRVNELTKLRAKARAELRDAEDLDDQQDAAYQAAVDAGMFDQEVRFDLKAECMRIHSEFCAMHGIREHHRPSDAEREAVCGGYYSTMARGG